MHPYEIEAFFRPRPWYRRVFQKELRHMGEHVRLLVAATRTLPRGKPYQEGGMGYRSPRWKQCLLMLRLFQRDWEKEKYRAIVEGYLALAQADFPSRFPAAKLGPFIRAQFQLARIRYRRFLDTLNEELIPMLSKELWKDRTFWRKLERWVRRSS
jgi:hypothetical protein